MAVLLRSSLGIATGVFAVAIATVILPNLSRHHAASSREAYSQTLDWALRMVLLIAVPAAAALMLLAEPILATLFLYGDVMTRGICRWPP